MRRALILAATLLFPALPACDAMPRAADPTLPPSVAQEEHHADHDGHDDGDGDHDHDHGPVPDDPATRAAAAKIRVLENDTLGCEEEALGVVDVHSGMHSTEQALDVLKRRAAVLGAEGVIGVDFHHGEGGHEPTHLSGMAVRCRDLIQGRAYDVLGKIDVNGAMGKEDDAFDELRSRAQRMGASMILGVSFEHGEGGDHPTRVTGTAIRFRE